MLTVDPARLDLRPGSKILDLGCGDGRHIRATRWMSGITGIGLDLGATEVGKAAASLRELDALTPSAGGSIPEAGSWCVIRGDGFALPFTAHAFDCVIVSEVLEHIHDDDAVLRELTRVLRPRGILAVSVPREGPEALCWLLSRQYRNTPGGHVRIYRRGVLRRKLGEHGYTVTASAYAHGLHTPFWWLKCLVGLQNDDALPVRLYHRLLVWDLMHQPLVTRMAERLLNPLIGKSVVFYATKEE